MSSNDGGATIQTGPPLDSDAEAAHKLQLGELYADQAEAEAGVIEEKLAGWQQALKDKKAEAKRLRAEAKEARG
jgi:hypothetical protein